MVANTVEDAKSPEESLGTVGLAVCGAPKTGKDRYTLTSNASGDGFSSLYSGVIFQDIRVQPISNKGGDFVSPHFLTCISASSLSHSFLIFVSDRSHEISISSFWFQVLYKTKKNKNIVMHPFDFLYYSSKTLRRLSFRPQLHEPQARLEASNALQSEFPDRSLSPSCYRCKACLTP